MSKLIASGMNRSAMYSSLTIVKNYAVDDKGMKVGFGSGLDFCDS